jgi:hypothetical protein
MSGGYVKGEFLTHKYSRDYYNGNIFRNSVGVKLMAILKWSSRRLFHLRERIPMS